METDGLFTLDPPAAQADLGAPYRGTLAGGSNGFGPPAPGAPLAVRMRPRTLDELDGQEHLLAPAAPLRQLVAGDTPSSVIPWGPPGSGKTTIAHLVADSANRRFVALSALSAGVKDVRAVIEEARRQRRTGGRA